MEKLPLTPRQKEILEFLGAHTRDFGYPPTVREICAATGLKSPRSVSQHLQALERKGYICRGRDKSRAIRFLERPDSLGPAMLDGIISLSLRGHVVAGHPVPKPEAHPATYLFDRALFGNPDHFLMRVEGDCMVDAHILEGDLIVVSPGPGAGHGDVVVARVGSEVSVKRFETRGAVDFLVSQVGEMRVDSVVPGIEILGKVVGLIRPAS
jgi:repressor LexA